MLCSCGTPFLVCTKYTDLKSPVAGCFSIVRHWGGDAHLSSLCSMTEMWGQCRDGKVCSSKVTMLVYLVTTYMVTHNFYPKWPLSGHNYSLLFSPSILDAAFSPKCYNVDSPLKQCAVTDFALNSLLPGFTWPLVRLSPKPVNILFAWHKGFTDWHFSEHLLCL